MTIKEISILYNAADTTSDSNILGIGPIRFANGSYWVKNEFNYEIEFPTTSYPEATILTLEMDVPPRFTNQHQPFIYTISPFYGIQPSVINQGELPYRRNSVMNQYRNYINGGKLQPTSFQYNGWTFNYNIPLEREMMENIYKYITVNGEYPEGVFKGWFTSDGTAYELPESSDFIEFYKALLNRRLDLNRANTAFLERVKIMETYDDYFYLRENVNVYPAGFVAS